MYLESKSYEKYGFLIKNRFKTKNRAICGFDMCVRKYHFDIQVYEIHARNVVKFKKYLKSKSYVIKTSDNKDVNIKDVNIERNNSRDSLDVIDPFQFNHTNDKRFDELQCNTEPKNTPLIPKIRLILDNVATDEN